MSYFYIILLILHKSVLNCLCFSVPDCTGIDCGGKGNFLNTDGKVIFNSALGVAGVSMSLLYTVSLHLSLRGLFCGSIKRTELGK